MLIGLLAGSADDVAGEARAAEAVGLDYLACGEHLFFYGPTPNAFVHLAAAAGATTRIRLVSTITLLPLYPAPLAAKLAVAVDRVSHGRFELGVGAGGEYPPEFEAVGVDPDDRFRRLDEHVRILRSLFGGERVSVSAEFTTMSGVALDPGPVQAGGPPIWLGGRGTGAVRRAGRLADVWMPYMVDPARFRTSLAQARQVAEDHGRGAAAVAGAVFLWACADADERWARASGLAAVSRTYAQDFAPLADRYLALGSPDQVVARLREFEAAGAERAILAPACRVEDRQRVLTTFAEEILPAFRGA